MQLERLWTGLQERGVLWVLQHPQLFGWGCWNILKHPEMEYTKAPEAEELEPGLESIFFYGLGLGPMRTRTQLGGLGLGQQDSTTALKAPPTLSSFMNGHLGKS